MYISLGSRPDITYAVSFLSRYLDKPNRKVWTGAKRVLRYLQHTKRMAIVYKQSNDKRLVAFSDSDWAQDSKDGKSVSGGIVFFCGNPVMWLSKKQTCVTLSSTEAEYVAAALISTEIISLKSICKDLINEDIETVLCMDNQGAMKISMNYENSRRSKHIDIKYHFIKDCVHQNAFSLQYVDTSRNTADILTKSLTRYVFESHTERMNLRRARKEDFPGSSPTQRTTTRTYPTLRTTKGTYPTQRTTKWTYPNRGNQMDISNAEDNQKDISHAEDNQNDISNAEDKQMDLSHAEENQKAINIPHQRTVEKMVKVLKRGL
ncbi:hypothetical protein WDU94_012392 [Cyamophila willieti]